MFRRATLIVLMLTATGAQAEETFKIGASVGLTGYATVTDRGWLDGVTLAAAALNAKGGVEGEKIEILSEDNHSQPLDAVTGYRKMIADGVRVFNSGCVSAGNFAAAAAVVKAKVPMLLCSIPPQKPDELYWAFSLLPSPRFDVEAVFAHLQKHKLTKVGLLHDPSPYAQLQSNIAEKIAKDFGIEIVATETYKQDDADLSTQLLRVRSAGAQAIAKVGQGGSSITLAKNIQQLAMTLPLVTSNDDVSIFKQVAQILGGQVFFSATSVQIAAARNAPTTDTQAGQAEFLKLWKDKYGERDVFAGAMGWDSVMVVRAAAQAAKSVDGAAIRDAIERLGPHSGAMATYQFSPEQHQGVTTSPYHTTVIRDGMLEIAD